MKNILAIRSLHIKTYVATMAVTLLGYVGVSCSKNCIQCYACLPPGALVLGLMLSKNIRVRFQKFFTSKKKIR